MEKRNLVSRVVMLAKAGPLRPQRLLGQIKLAGSMNHKQREG